MNKISVAKNYFIKSIRQPRLVARLRSVQGFTLIELMITIAAILLAVGVSSMRDMIQQSCFTGSVNEFVAANMLARSEAIKRGSTVTLCRAVNAESGSNACAAAGDWMAGRSGPCRQYYGCVDTPEITADRNHGCRNI